MLLSCPACNATYDLPPDMIPDEGARLVCSGCGGTWDTGPAAPGAGPVPLADMPAEEDGRQEDGAQKDGPEAAAPEPPPGRTDPAPLARRREVDPGVLAILREEAARERAAREAEEAARAQIAAEAREARRRLAEAAARAAAEAASARQRDDTASARQRDDTSSARQRDDTSSARQRDDTASARQRDDTASAPPHGQTHGQTPPAEDRPQYAGFPMSDPSDPIDPTSNAPAADGTSPASASPAQVRAVGVPPKGPTALGSFAFTVRGTAATAEPGAAPGPRPANPRRVAGTGAQPAAAGAQTAPPPPTTRKNDPRALSDARLIAGYEREQLRKARMRRILGAALTGLVLAVGVYLGKDPIIRALPFTAGPMTAYATVIEQAGSRLSAEVGALYAIAKDWTLKQQIANLDKLTLPAPTPDGTRPGGAVPGGAEPGGEE